MYLKIIRPQQLLFYVCASLSLALLLTFCIFPAHAQARATLAPTDAPTMNVSLGFNSRYRDGDWIPVQVTLKNPGSDFNGIISLNIPAPYAGYTNTQSSTNKYQQTISLSTGAQKQVTLYIPLMLGAVGATQTISVDLLDTNGQKIATQTSTLRSLGPNDILVGVLSDQTSGITALGQVTQPNQTASVFEEPLNATNMPKLAAALKNFDMIVLDNFTTSSLSKEQFAALENWVSQGGDLVVVGGPEWRRTLSPLPADLLPVDIAGTTTLAPGTDLFPIGGPTRSGPGGNSSLDRVPGPVTVSTATAHAGSTVLLANNRTPLLVTEQHNLGTIYYMAFDPSLTPLANWSNASNLWKGILIRSLGDQFLDTSQNPNAYPNNRYPYDPNNSWSSLLQSLFPNAFPATWMILVLLIGYVVILGPVRLITIRLLKKRTWSWRIVLATIVVFSLLSYGLALQEKGTSIINSSISVLRFDKANAAGTNAHITTYVGVFVPNQGDFQVHLPGNNLVQPLSDDSRMYQTPGMVYQSGKTTTTITPNGTNVDLQGVDIWTMRAVVAQHDAQIRGGISSQLTLQNGMLQGTITNTLPYGLNDVYVLINNQYISLGHIGSKQSNQINVGINATGNTQSLADQIAASHGLPVPYMPYSTAPQGQNEIQRHMAMLSTISNEASSYYCGGGFCSQSISIAGGAAIKQVYYGGKAGSLNGSDPLLIPGSPVTLVGWADSMPSEAGQTTINGNNANGVQEAMIQAPLDVTYAGSVNVPTNMAIGQLVDIQSQGANIQTELPGVYGLSTGSMTFEVNVPNIAKLHTSSMNIIENTNMLNGITNTGNAGNLSTDISHVHVYVYNWRTRSWDSFAFSAKNATLVISNAQDYINADGRALIQFANQDSSQGTMLISKPILQLQGQIGS